MSRPDTADFRQLFLNDVPMMDVRAPVEFEQGAFPHSVNLPLMDNSEREQVGTRYKNAGQDAAIELGHELVQGNAKAERVAAWRAFAEANPNGYLYCFRGGLRSKVTQQWLAEAGIEYPFVTGGYKAMRRYLIDAIDSEAASNRVVILSGRTGSGKTKVIEAVDHALDLEGYANHRGSSFGRRASPQPSQINFENMMAVDLIKRRNGYEGPLLVEDESNAIGSLHVPHLFFESMRHAPLVLLEESMEYRIDTVIEDYVIGLSKEHMALDPDNGFANYSDYMLSGMDRIRKRLGSERHKEIKTLMQQALDEHQRTNDLSLHRVWIEALLGGYYDPMYDYQLSKKQGRVIFRGDSSALKAWFSEYCLAREGA